MKATRKLIIPAIVLGLAGTACSSKAVDDSPASETEGVVTGAGVTDEEITLGALVPLSGPIGGLGQDGVAGVQLYFDQVNADGGVCDRTIRIDARDNKYNSQETMTQYTAFRNEIAAIVNLSPGTDAVTLKDRLDQDGLAVLAGSYDPVLLTVPQAFMPGAPYDVEAVNGVSHLVSEGVLSEGDTIGVIAYPVGIGESVADGVKGAAEFFGLEVVETKIDNTATDATSQVTTLRNAGAKAIVMGTAGAQTVSAASVAQSSGYDVTILATNLLSAGDLEGPAAEAITEHVVLTSNSAPFSSDAPAVQELLEAWEADSSDRPITAPVAAGYLMAKVLNTALVQACEDGDLTPQSITASLAKVGAIGTDGLGVDLDYSTAGDAPSLASFILRPDAGAEGGAVVVAEPEASEAAQEYAAAQGYAK